MNYVTNTAFYALNGGESTVMGDIGSFTRPRRNCAQSGHYNQAMIVSGQSFSRHFGSAWLQQPCQFAAIDFTILGDRIQEISVIKP
jgi:hypothetical protein